MSTLRFREALRQAMIEEMDRDERVFLMGEEVGYYQGAYKVSEGMLDQFGAKRVIDAPIAEAGFAGIGVGAAMVGLRPIIEFMTWNFSAVAFDQILSNAAKIRQMSGGQFAVPIVFRAPNASAAQVGAQHSHAMEHFYAQIPGVKVIAPATPADAKGMMKAAIRDDNPVLVMESETLYSVKGEVPDDTEYLVPFGKATIAREGKDVTIVAWSRIVHVALDAAKELEKEGIEVEVIDLRSLRPLDTDTIIASVTKTHRAVVAGEGWPYGGVGAEVVDRIQRFAFDDLDAPIERVQTMDVPMPYNAKLEQLVIPQSGADRGSSEAHALRGRGDRSMAKVLEMPKLSPTMTEGQLTVWHKKRAIRSPSTICSPRSRPTRRPWSFAPSTRGRSSSSSSRAGSQVLLGQPVAIIGATGEDVSALVASRAGVPPALPLPRLPPPRGCPLAPAARHRSAAAAAIGTAAAPVESRANGRVKASPYVRKVARERNIDLWDVSGTGPNGRIVRARSRARPHRREHAPPRRRCVPLAEADEVRPLSMMRKTIARRLTESKQSVPHFYLTIDVDAAPISRLREQINADIAASAPRADGEKAAQGLHQRSRSSRPAPSRSSAYRSATQASPPKRSSCIAAWTSRSRWPSPRGSITPVVRGADKKSIVAIAQEVRELAGRAKAKKLRPEEMADGTFSISNLGMFGIDSFSAVINPPEGAILAVGRIRDEPVVWEGAVVPGRGFRMTLSCDHRVVDGAVGAEIPGGAPESHRAPYPNARLSRDDLAGHTCRYACRGARGRCVPSRAVRPMLASAKGRA